MNSDRNLLLGVLALQMDFITRDALVEAMASWTLKKDRSIGEVLLERNDLTPSRLQLLDALVKEHLATHDDDAQKSLASLPPLGSARQALDGVADSDMQKSLSIVPADSSRSSPTLPRPAGGAANADQTIAYTGRATSEGGRFRVLRLHARGGQGEVSVALDTELTREVALKEIQEKFADADEVRRRFVREAEITGGLEHPGIVPVYGLGHYDNGRPFYAMRFVRGDSLSKAIKRFHSDDRLRGARRELEFRKLLGRLIDVCHAMHYAHSRGVLHRDLKPGNIMVGKYGETLIVDWGLAASERTTEVDATELPLRAPSGSDSRTMSGSIIGTPAYMSPEQAAGEIEQLGPQSDVYSLGATLYTLLTGKPPAKGSSDEVMQQVIAGDIVPPRKVGRGVPRSLQAVCQRAMALKKEDRYETCDELADELEAYLADVAVSAYRSPLYRLRLWASRHRAALAAALLVLAVCGAGWGYIQRHRSRLALRIQRHVDAARIAVQAGDFASGETRLASADSLSNDLGDDRVNARIERWDKQVKAMLSLQELLARIRLGAIYYRSRPGGDERHEVGGDSPGVGHDAVEADCRAALGLFAALDNEDFIDSLAADTILSSAQIDRLKADMGDVFAYYAIARAARFDDDEESRQRTRDALALLARAMKLTELGFGAESTKMRWFRRIGENALADEAGDRAVEIAKSGDRPSSSVIDRYLFALNAEALNAGGGDFAPLYEEVLRLQPNHFRSHFALFDAHRDSGNREGQRRHLEACIALAPDNPQLFYFRGMLLFEEQKYNEALADFSAAVRIDPSYATGYFYRGRMKIVGAKWKSALEDLDLALKHSGDKLFSARRWRGVVAAKTGDHATAVADAEQSMIDVPNDAFVHYFAARIYAQSARAAKQDSRDDLAAKYTDRCRETIEEAVRLGFEDFTRLSPGSDFDPVWESAGFKKLVRNFVLTALTIAEQEWEKDRGNLDLRLRRGQLRYVLGVSHIGQTEGSDEQAVDALAKSVQQLLPLVLQPKVRSDARTFAKLALRERSKALDRLGRHREADESWKRWGILATSKREQREMSVQRGYDLAVAGAVGEAARIADELDGVALSSRQAYNVACICSVASRAAGMEKDPDRQKLQPKASDLRDKSLGWLRKAKVLGFFGESENVDQLRKDPDLTEVREHPDYPAFEAELGSSSLLQRSPQRSTR